MGRILVVRHGATHLNSEQRSQDRIRGWLDIPLTTEGKEDAEDLAGALKRFPIKQICSSDLRRAMQTAEVIQKELDLPKVEASKNWRPWDLGDFAGQLAKLVAPEIKRYLRTPKRAVPGGEPFCDFFNRFHSALKKLMEECQFAKGDVCVCTHFRDFRLLRALEKTGFKDDPSILGFDFFDGAEKPGCALVLTPGLKGWDLRDLSVPKRKAA